MDWSRHRTVGIDLLIVGILVLLVSLGFALSAACAPGGVCSAQVDWPTLAPSLALIVAGGVILYLARRDRAA